MWHKGKTVHVAAAGAVIVLGTAVGVPTAYADDEPTQPWAEIQAPRQIDLPSAADGQEAVAPSVSYSFADGGAEFPLPKNAKLVIDASGLEGIATIKAKNEQCTASGAVVTCLDNGNLHGPWEPFTLTADADAKPGASGTISYEVTADGATGDKDSSKVVVGSPRLVVGKLPDRSGLKTGDTVDLPLAVRNTGNLRTERVDIRLRSVPGVEFTTKPKNCRFAYEWDESASVYCAIDTPLEPGQSAKLSTPLTAKITKAALAPWIDYEAEAVPASSDEDPNGTPGTGSPIGLTAASGGDFETGGKSSLSLLTDNHADFRAVGGTIEPTADGTTGGLRFGLTNAGPAAAYRKDGKPLLYADITLPKGVTGLSNHIDEEPDQDTTGECLTYVSPTETKKFEPGHSRYLCPEASTELPGEGQMYGLGVKIAKDADKNATGTVKLVPGPAGFSTNDPDSGNDTAKITFKGASGGSSTGGESTGGSDHNGSGSGSGSQDGATSGSGGDSGSGGSGDGATSGGSHDSGSTGGSMALTGAGGITLMAGGAAAALALGGAAVVVTRRRRAAARV